VGQNVANKNLVTLEVYPRDESIRVSLNVKNGAAPESVNGRECLPDVIVARPRRVFRDLKPRAERPSQVAVCFCRFH